MCVSSVPAPCLRHGGLAVGQRSSRELPAGELTARRGSGQWVGHVSDFRGSSDTLPGPSDRCSTRGCDRPSKPSLPGCPWCPQQGSCLKGRPLLPGASRSPRTGLRSQRTRVGTRPGAWALCAPWAALLVPGHRLAVPSPAAGAGGVGVTHLQQPLTNPLVLLLLCAHPILFPSGSESFHACSPLLPR